MRQGDLGRISLGRDEFSYAAFNKAYADLEGEDKDTVDNKERSFQLAHAKRITAN